VLLALLTLGGLFYFHEMKVQNVPDVERPMITITIVAALPLSLERFWFKC
jgi:multidrug efflux pump subunit AcrB